MLLTLTLDDSSGTPVTLHAETGTRQVGKVLGLVGVGAVRESRRVKPQSHGALDESRFEDGRLITIEGALSGASPEVALSEFRAITQPMVQTWDVGPALLKWSEGTSGLQLQREVKLASEVDPPIDHSSSFLEYQASFFAEDPRAYSQTLTSVTGAALSTADGGMVIPFTFPITYNQSGGGVVTFNNAGTRPTPVITYRIYGQVTNPTIVQQGTTNQIVLNGTVQAGDFLDVDASTRTVKLNGTVSRQNFLDSANTTWVDAPVGNSTWQLIAGSFDANARLDLFGRSAY